MGFIYECVIKVLFWFGFFVDNSDVVIDGIFNYGKVVVDVGLFDIKKEFFEIWLDVGDDFVNMCVRDVVVEFMVKVNVVEGDVDCVVEWFLCFVFVVIICWEYFNCVWIK